MVDRQQGPDQDGDADQQQLGIGRDRTHDPLGDGHPQDQDEGQTEQVGPSD